MTAEKDLGYYSHYDLNSGTRNTWRMTYRWPVIGKGDLKVWALIPATWLIAFIFSGLLTEMLWYPFYILCTIALLCKFSRRDPMQLKRFLFQRLSINHKTATPVWSERSNFFQVMIGIAIMSTNFLISDNAYAKFEIVIPPKQAQVDSYASSGQIYLQGGFGKDVKLYDLLSMLLPTPLSAEYANAEIKDLKVSWYSSDRIYLNEVLASISRRFGVLFTWRNREGVLEVRWDNGVCKKIIAESIQKQAEYSKSIGYEIQSPQRVVTKITNPQLQMEIVC
ncbi:hypothetical protein OCF84_20800 (plasmid) [Shewanella xiamenensis]|uniref:Uncharacterized protein n=1 Tax=Shewanella xiamenensis TaxID=332186 RepID=A0ABT6UH39_9GAMM|nr:hypothetical protein [Shewanella xiamenensis]MDI5833292.1 hypothetical protein [Shewanella xiamenensis]WHF57958.1 hypothetical protein OCF84_20800 [Shewanella xiamenensis]